MSCALKADSLILVILCEGIDGVLPLLDSSLLLLLELLGFFFAGVAEVEHELRTEVHPSQGLGKLY